MPTPAPSEHGPRRRPGAAGEPDRAFAVEGSHVVPGRVGQDQVSRALLLLQEAVDAQAAGDKMRAAAIAARVHAEFPPELVSELGLGMLLAAGRRQGWLPEADHDRLRAAFPDGEVAQQLGTIRRGRPGG